ncbi:hypothetical protein P3T43_002084 [Paraburkholderia sp. GAS41]
MRLDPSRPECLRTMPCMTPLSSIPERLRCRAGLQALASRPGATLAPSVGSLPGSMMVDAGGYCRSPECEKPVPDGSPDHAGIRRVLRRGRSFCLRVCGCAPSAVRPAKTTAASTLSRRVRRMYARPGGLSNGGFRGTRGGAMHAAHAKKRRGEQPRADAAMADCRTAYSPIARAAPSSS